MLPHRTCVLLGFNKMYMDVWTALHDLTNLLLKYRAYMACHILQMCKFGVAYNQGKRLDASCWPLINTRPLAMSCWMLQVPLKRQSGSFVKCGACKKTQNVPSGPT